MIVTVESVTVDSLSNYGFTLDNNEDNEGTCCLGGRVFLGGESRTGVADNSFSRAENGLAQERSHVSIQVQLSWGS